MVIDLSEDGTNVIEAHDVCASIAHVSIDPTGRSKTKTR